jgi:hypothetical protein
MSLLAALDVSTQPDIPRPWRLGGEARDYIVGLQKQQPDLELTVACGVDFTERMVTTATFCGWGTRLQGFMWAGDFSAGTMAVHTHPALAYRAAEGSEADLKCAIQLAEYGIGFGVVNGDGIGLLVMREPRAFKEPTGPRPNVWTWGRYTLIRSAK